MAFHQFGLNCVLQEFIYRRPNPPVPQNVTVFGKTIIADVISLDEVIRLGWALIQYNQCPHKKGKSEHGDALRENTT